VGPTEKGEIGSREEKGFLKDKNWKGSKGRSNPEVSAVRLGSGSQRGGQSRNELAKKEKITGGRKKKVFLKRRLFKKVPIGEHQKEKRLLVRFLTSKRDAPKRGGG